MNDIRLNLLETLEIEEKKHVQFLPVKKTSFFRKKKSFLIKIFVIFLIASFFLFTRGIITESVVIQEIPKLSFWEGVVRTLVFQEHLLQGELSDRINILILGRGGEQHEGPNLTDTMILLSYKPSTQELALLSIPRDLWVEIPGYGFSKINAANAIGNEKNNNGNQLTSSIVGSILELPIHYFINLDFNGFKEIVDALGGVEIYVDQSFIDNSYPNNNYGYTTIRFEKGLQKMSGARALEYARSRHGTNGEDSDFARMKRQQKLIYAIKEKIKKIKFLQQPQKIFTLFNLSQKYFQTNLNVDEAIIFARMAEGVNGDKIITKSLEIGEDAPLIEDYYNGAYILRTRTGDFKEISQIAKDIFNKNPSAQIKLTINNKPKIIVLNGTTIDGLARSKITPLINDFQILNISNADHQDYEETIIYDLTNGQKNRELELLKEKIDGQISNKIEELEGLTTDNADFVIILGSKQNLP